MQREMLFYCFYFYESSYNPEVELMKKSAPSFRIGTSTRDHLGGDST